MLFAKAMVAMAFLVAVYAFLVFFFFTCCGLDAFSSASYANPARSPLGPVVTILIVWPLGGFLCLVLQGALEGILETVGRRMHAAIRAIRRPR